MCPCYTLLQLIRFIICMSVCVCVFERQKNWKNRPNVLSALVWQCHEHGFPYETESGRKRRTWLFIIASNYYSSKWSKRQKWGSAQLPNSTIGTHYWTVFCSATARGQTSCTYVCLSVYAHTHNNYSNSTIVVVVIMNNVYDLCVFGL